MTRSLHRLRRLQSITDAVLLAEQSRLRAIAMQEDRVKALLAELDSVRLERTGSASREPDPAARAGADPRWQLWAEDRRRSLNLDLARLRVQREGIKSDLARALGRNDVSQKIVEATRFARLDELRKRQDYNTS